MNRKTIGTAIFLYMCFIAAASAEPFRVRDVTVVTISAESASQTAQIGFNDALVIVLPEEPLFLRGIELEMKIPQVLLSYRNSIGYAVYENVSPLPSADIIDYSGDRVCLEPLPARLNFVLQIPTDPGYAQKTTPYVTVLGTVTPNTDGSVFFRLLPVMKGLPENVENLVFTVEVKPILKNEGIFELDFTYPDENVFPVSVSIDEKPVKDYSKGLILTPGMHHLSVVSDNYRNEMRVFNIEQAKTTKLNVELKDISPLITFVAPENTLIYVNDSQITATDSPVKVSAGENIVRFVVGDYEVKKAVHVQTGKEYVVSLTIDVQITETP